MSEIRTIAEIEADNERLASLEASRFKAEERYNHTVLEDEGFIIESDMAYNLIKTFSPDKLAIKCDRYYFVNDKYSAAIVGVDNQNIGLFTMEIPKEIDQYVADSMNMDSALEYYNNELSRYRSVKYIGYFILALITAVTVAVIVLTFSFNSTTAMLIALLGFGLIATIVIGGL